MAQTKGTVVITGGSRGIGAATALLAAKAGYDICINYQANEKAAINLLETISEQGGNAIAVKADISQEADVLHLFAEVDAELGNLKGLVNCAGIMDKSSSLVDMDVQRLQKVMDINVVGTMLCAREAAKRMSLQRGGTGGAIVNISSVAAKNGAASEGVEYAASKGAVEAFTNGLGRELAPQGIRVNCVRPGLTKTDLHALTGNPDRIHTLAPSVPLKRVAEPEEIAKAIVWLLSEEASYCVGSILEAGGGR
ncbi:SDR family oxidoreductase [Polycladidibacter stylochi]|uniref:SDR family oxidoreductase n=1 Tax=Polycladidibacter stylochi TaxID=1807766 RepID=UPI00082B385C|nr:SDR family oxidoreductase [Pseudovibrio stylochi]